MWILWCLLQLPLSVNVLDSLNRNLVFEVITLTDKIHIQYGDHTYRHVGDRVLKKGVKMSYWVHTLGPVAVKVVHLHACTRQKFTTHEKVSMDQKLDLSVLDDLTGESTIEVYDKSITVTSLWFSM